MTTTKKDNAKKVALKDLYAGGQLQDPDQDGLLLSPSEESDGFDAPPVKPGRALSRMSTFAQGQR